MKYFIRKTLLLLFLSSAHTLYAQEEYFNYEDDSKTVISGVNETGIGYLKTEDKSLCIPSTVKKVLAGAFFNIKYWGAELSDLIIDGGNPEFELSEEGYNALSDVNGSLSKIEIQGTAMTADNLRKLLSGMNNVGNFELLDIYNDKFPLEENFTSTSIDENLNGGVTVELPASRVGNQKFGNAKVYGRFSLTSEIASFCGSQYLYDEDDGSQFLFYIPTEIIEEDGAKKLYIKRVRSIFPNQGVLLHNIGDSSSDVKLLRITEDDVPDSDIELYEKNMLKGVTTATRIGATETIDGEEYYNMILYNAAFYRTSGGTIGANKAYLQVKKSDMEGAAKLTMAVADNDEQETTVILLPVETENDSDVWFSISGQRLNGCPQQHGIYIHKGKKVIK